MVVKPVAVAQPRDSASESVDRELAQDTVCEVSGILGDDTFGRHTFIRAAGQGPETDWQRFAMFHLTEHGQRPSAPGNLFYLVAAGGKVRSGALGRRHAAAGPIKDDDVRIRYVAGTTVPDNWIPFIPVHAEGSVSEIARDPSAARADGGGGQPRGRLLRESRSPYFIEEEEVPRSGSYVERSWQRARWIGDRTLLWVGRRKTAGRGEGWSNLVFDRIQDLAPKKP
jgi:hypothetical protein